MSPKQVTPRVKDKMGRVSDGMEKAQIKCLKAPEAEPCWRVWTIWFIFAQIQTTPQQMELHLGVIEDV